LYPSGKFFRKGSMAMARLFYTMCHIILESRLPENSKQGLVLISISQTFPFESIKKS
jgi:hypothetical protein